MTRRQLFALAAAAVLDPERALWVPGRKMISIARDRYFRIDFGAMPLFTSIQNGGPDPVKLDCFRIIWRQSPVWSDVGRIGNVVYPGECFQIDTIGPDSARVTQETRLDVLSWGRHARRLLETTTTTKSSRGGYGVGENPGSRLFNS